MNNFEILDSRKILGKEITTFGTLENPLFLAKDVAEWIGYSSDKVGQLLKSVDQDEKQTSPIHYSGQVREMWFLTEDGLYEVLMQSRKPIAKKLKKEIKKILKQIRLTGGYIP
ncbi:Bro-N domain-containing protein, partial [uncultured Clostridium sp.]